MCSVCEHPEYIPIIHYLNIVNVLVFFVHLLIIMSLYIRLPITVNIAVLYYSATLCSIYTVESDRNINFFPIFFVPKIFFSSKCLIPLTGENKNRFFRYRNFCNALLQKFIIIICPEIVSNR